MDPGNPSDEHDAVTASLLAARDGDRDAARTFVAATQPLVWRLLAHLSDPGVAEDLTQETYERAFIALPRFRASASARTWLFAIARRVAADHLRRRRRRPRTVGVEGEDELGRGAVATGDHSERVALDAVLSALAPDRHEAFVLTQVVGLGYHEAAAVVGCPVGTIRSRVARARADLVAALEGDPRRREARPEAG